MQSFRDLLPPVAAHVAVALPAPDLRDPRVAFPDVSLAPELRGAVPKRQIEFLAGRHCARAVLRALGCSAAEAPIGIGALREPLWPPGFVGSITHTSGFAAAAAARTSDALGLGIDTEHLLALTKGRELLPSIGTPGEIVAAREDGGLDEAAALTLLFSGKESLFKCLAPRVGRYFEFHDAELVGVDSVRGEFRVRLVVDLSAALPRGSAFVGRFAVEEGYVHTAIVVAT